jgi:NAD(P)-dependent dehydrogenase (short-subunit alcohol dehydrogenase family)
VAVHSTCTTHDDRSTDAHRLTRYAAQGGGAVSGQRRVALVANTASYVGPDLARSLASRGHDLVIGDPVEGLVAELDALGAAVEVVDGVHNLATTGSADALVDAAITRFGRVDCAAAATGRIVVGRFLKSSLEDLRAAVLGCLEAPYNFLRAVVPVMVDRGEGQVLVITSASAVRPTPGAPLYSSARAGANMLVRNVADEIAATGVQVNSVGTNFMDFPEFLAASNATTPEGRARVEALVPMGRLGTMQEFASFCMPYLDGTSRFTTGQFVAYAGGWA